MVRMNKDINKFYKLNLVKDYKEVNKERFEMSMHKVKVCHITTVHPSFDARIFHKECKTLAKAGYEVYLIVTHDREEIIDGVHIIPLPDRNGRFYRFFVKDWLALFKAIKVNADIYHFHDPELILTGLILKLFGKKVIYDVHEDYPEIVKAHFHKSRVLKFIVSGFVNFLQRNLAKIFDALVFPTEELSKKFDHQKKIVLINFPLRNKISAYFYTKRKKVYDILYLGTISPFRMEFFIRIMEEIKKKRENYNFLFLGISKKTIKWCQENVESSLMEHIVFKERVPYREVFEIAGSAKIGVNYHPYEERFMVAIPVKIFEYMALGLPVVTTALPEINKYLGDYNGKFGFLIKDNNPSVFANRVVELLSDSDKMVKMGKKGRSLVLEKLNWETSEAPKLISLYKEMINYAER